MCIVCKVRPAAVPDRDAFPGRFVRKVCAACHADRLRSDLRGILSVIDIQNAELAKHGLGQSKEFPDGPR